MMVGRWSFQIRGPLFLRGSKGYSLQNSELNCTQQRRERHMYISWDARRTAQGLRTRTRVSRSQVLVQTDEQMQRRGPFDTRSEDAVVKGRGRVTDSAAGG